MSNPIPSCPRTRDFDKKKEQKKKEMIKSSLEKIADNIQRTMIDGPMDNCLVYIEKYKLSDEYSEEVRQAVEEKGYVCTYNRNDGYKAIHHKFNIRIPKEHEIYTYKYCYTAIDPSGKRTMGEIKAESASDANNQLKNKGLFLTSLSQKKMVTQRNGHLSDWGILLSNRCVKFRNSVKKFCDEVKRDW